MVRVVHRREACVNQLQGSGIKKNLADGRFLSTLTGGGSLTEGGV